MPPEGIGQRPDRSFGAYRSFMRSSEQENLLRITEEAYLGWLGGKGIELDAAGTGVTSRGAEARATLRSLDGGTQTLLSGSLVENTAADRWTTELLASSAGWIHLDVRSAAGRYSAVPKLARILMQEMDLRDASLMLRHDVRMWDVGELDQLLDLLMSPDRTGLVLVAGTGPEPQLFEGFKERLPRWTSDTYGLAQVISLTPQATHALARRLDVHGTQPWTIRTYYPGLRLGSSVDARRHRYLSVATLAQQTDGRIRHLLGNVARFHAAQREVPTEVVVARRALERASAHELLDRLSQSTVGFQLPSLEDDHDIQPTADTPTSAAPVSGVQDPLRLVCETLGVEEITPLTLRAALARYADSVQRDLRGELEAAGQLLEDQMERTAQLDDDNRNLRISADDDELEIAELMDQADRLRGEVRWLRAELAAKGEYETAYGVAGADVSDEYPSSCEDLVLGLDGNVVFTGDLDEVRFVDERDTFGGCAREATRCVRTLEQYVKAKACGDTSKGVHHFLQHCPPGYDVVSSGKHALGESGYTMTHHGDERIFPVPAEVSPDGHSRMVAHFKLARIGQVTPRMYYLDDTAGTGCIYIGYLGRHLTNRMS